MEHIEEKILWEDFDTAKKITEIENNPFYHIKEKEKQIRNWLKFRNEVYGRSNIDKDHACTYRCALSDSIHLIDAALNLYGCIESGKYHFCEPENLNCPHTMLNKDGTFTCIFSGIDMGVLIDDNMYKKADTGTDHHNNECHEFEELKMERLLKKKSDLSLSLNDNISIPDVDEEEGEYSIYNWVDSSATKRKQKKQQRKSLTKINDSNLRKDIESIIYDLIYNSSERIRIDKKRVREMKKSAINTIHKYYKKCKRNKSRPIRHYIEKIYDNQMNKKRRMRPLKLDRTRLLYYSNVIINLWKIIINTDYCAKNKSKFHIKQHTIGTLYLLQTPLFINGEDELSDQDQDQNQNQNLIMPRDEFLYNQLPHENNLKEWQSCHTKHWNYSKGDVTKGRNNFKLALNSITDIKKQKQIINIMQKISRESP